MSDTVNTTSLQENESTEEVVDKLAYTKKDISDLKKSLLSFLLTSVRRTSLSLSTVKSSSSSCSTQV